MDLQAGFGLLFYKETNYRHKLRAHVELLEAHLRRTLSCVVSFQHAIEAAIGRNTLNAFGVSHLARRLTLK